MPSSQDKAKVVVSKNGPYIVSGALPLMQMIIGTDPEGGSERWLTARNFAVTETYALCRCGHSQHKPFCDNSHKRVGFDGEETASREPYVEQARRFDGPVMALTDAEGLCAFARFCDPNGQVWSQVARTDDPDIRATFLRQVAACPSGRLVAWDKATGRPEEEQLPAAIGVVEDPEQQCSGPLWLRGGVPVFAADGQAYEVRMRVTLCRCGQSRNKPFCDGTHAAIGFQDGL
jgi:CDGSH-type Zn-finger protein